MAKGMVGLCPRSLYIPAASWAKRLLKLTVEGIPESNHCTQDCHLPIYLLSSPSSFLSLEQVEEKYKIVLLNHPHPTRLPSESSSGLTNEYRVAYRDNYI